MERNKRSDKETVIFLIYLLLFAAAVISIAVIQPLKSTEPFLNPPDEADRFLVPSFICENGTLPTGFEPEVTIQTYGGSYAFYNVLPYIIMGYLMRVVRLLGGSGLLLLYTARSVNVAAGVITAFFVFLIGKKLFKKEIYSYVFSLFTMFLPQHLFLYTYVNTDAFCLMSVALIIYVFLDSYENGVSFLRVLLLAAGISICALSYYMGYGVLLVSVPLFVFCFFKGGRFDSRSFIKYAALEILFVALFSGWWFVRCYFVLDGDILGLRSLSAAQQLAIDRGESVKNIPAESMSVIQFLTRTTVLKDMPVSFVAMYGSMSLWAGDVYYVLYLLFIAAGALTGFVISIGQLKNRSFGAKVLEAGGIAFALITVGIWFIYCYFIDMQPQGRYVMPVVFVPMYYAARGYKKITDMIKWESAKKYVPFIISAFVIVMFVIYVYVEVYPLYLARPVWSNFVLPL
ncbi:MAG: glycosyltransferase family 39 protein [Lachnospiraceae bacterium]|nr:glycosyltransferase family 39 protein [Lachnospiraceae bacterium]